MTPNSPTWGDVEDFLKSDNWQQISAAQRGGKRQRHIFFEKALPDGRLLQTHISHDRSATLSPGRFGAILRNQLEVSRDEFWTAIHSQEEVDRPADIDEDTGVEHPLWVVQVLTGVMHMTPDQVENLGTEEAQRLVHEYWATPRDP
jgi:hypothetical protein